MPTWQEKRPAHHGNCKGEIAAMNCIASLAMTIPVKEFCSCHAWLITRGAQPIAACGFLFFSGYCDNVRATA